MKSDVLTAVKLQTDLVHNEQTKFITNSPQKLLLIQSDQKQNYKNKK